MAKPKFSVIGDALIAEAMNFATKKATVEEALRRVVRRHQRLDGLADMAGLGWEGDLAAMREARTLNPQQ